jgi:hypothetical protein
MVLFLLFIQQLLTAQGVKFVHVATSSNILSNWTVIDQTLLNGDPNAILFVTQNWNPGGSSGVYNDAEIGVWYDGFNWAIFNQNLVAMPEGASFNVFIHTGSNDFIHTATAGNISLNWTNIDHPSLNGNPDAIFLVTQNYNPGATGGVYNNSNIGVWYTGTNWAIFNQDELPMPEGAAFNVYVHNGTDDFIHTATASNIISNWTVLDDPALNSDPNAIFFVTQNWNPSGALGVYNDASMGVWYDGSNWAIFNQNIAAMPEGASFNVYVATTGILDVEDKQNALTNNYWLDQNYPNPFNPSTSIQYRVSVPALINLKVYTILGNEIAVLVNEEKSAGNYEVKFDAPGLPSGIYFYKLQAGNFVETKKMVLLK